MHAPRNALRGLNIDISIGGPTATTTRGPARAAETCCGADILASLIEQRAVFTSAGFIGSRSTPRASAFHVIHTDSRTRSSRNSSTNDAHQNM
jgi:hypothetical protein